MQNKLVSLESKEIQPSSKREWLEMSFLVIVEAKVKNQNKYMTIYSN